MKKTRFHIGDYHVDLLRSEIKRNDEITSIEPKVLQVLLLLAEHQGEVVTHQEIMDSVWQDVEVVPNALQRCIAQARKALNDNAKAQQVIVTHPKVGYSLVLPVTWLDDTVAKKSATSTRSERKRTLKHRTASIIFSLIIGVIIFTMSMSDVLFSNTNEPNRYTQLREITQSDQSESGPTYSYDGKYIVFNRYNGICESHIWAKHMKSGEEFQLTLESKVYGEPSFAQGGRELVFSELEQCDKLAFNPTNATQCWHLSTLNFANALSSPQSTTLKYQCNEKLLEKPRATPHGRYTFLEFSGKRYTLMQLDERTQQRRVLFQDNTDFIYDYDFDIHSNTFAVISRNTQNQDTLTLLNSQGKIQFKTLIDKSNLMGEQDYIEASFDKSGAFLLTTNTKGVFKLQLDGTLELLSMPNEQILNVDMHPTDNSLIAVKGSQDIDIAKVDISKPQPSQLGGYNKAFQPFPSLARTTSIERAAKFRPGNPDHIAFISTRSGYPEIWLWNGSKARQLTFDRLRTYSLTFTWSPDGQKIAYSTEGTVKITDLNGKSQSYDFIKNINSILNWYDNEHILVYYSAPNQRAIKQINLHTAHEEVFKIGRIKQAFATGELLIYSDFEGKVWRSSLFSPIEERAQLHGINPAHFIIKNNAIFSIDEKSLDLYQFDLWGKKVRKVTSLRDQAIGLTDIHQSHILVNQKIASNKRLVLMQ